MTPVKIDIGAAQKTVFHPFETIDGRMRSIAYTENRSRKSESNKEKKGIMKKGKKRAFCLAAERTSGQFAAGPRIGSGSGQLSRYTVCTIQTAANISLRRYPESEIS